MILIGNAAIESLQYMIRKSELLSNMIFTFQKKNYQNP